MHSLEFNYLHDLATTNYNLDNRPDPDSKSIILKEDLVEAFGDPRRMKRGFLPKRNTSIAPPKVAPSETSRCHRAAKRFCSP